METKNILPVLDTDVLQQKANEFAAKGAIKAIEDFYTGYDSPYKKAITENLQNKGTEYSIKIPDIIGILNEKISNEVDIIANTAVSKTFLPMVREFLTRADAEMKLSDILEEFIESTDYKDDEDHDKDDYSLEIKKEDGSFLYIIISDGKLSYEIGFYIQSKKEEPIKVGHIFTLPRLTNKADKYASITRTMKISLDGGATLELPFTPKVLEDNFMTFIAKLIIAKTNVTIDVDGFNDDMFPEREECHC